MRTIQRAVFDASLIPFSALPLHDLEVENEVGLWALSASEREGKRVLVKSTGIIYRWQADDLWIDHPFKGGSSSSIGIAKGTGERA